MMTVKYSYLAPNRFLFLSLKMLHQCECLASPLLSVLLVDTLASSEDDDEDEESSSEEAKQLGSQKLMRKCAYLFTVTNGHDSLAQSHRVVSHGR